MTRIVLSYSDPEVEPTHIDDLTAMIKAVDIQRMAAYRAQYLDRYYELSGRYGVLQDQYFELIRNQKCADKDHATKKETKKINKGRLNIEKHGQGQNDQKKVLGR